MRYRTVLVLMLVLAVPLMGADSCEEEKDTSNTTKEQREQTQEMTAQAHDKVGMPNITDYSERRLLKRIQELRDGMIGTHSYIINRQGEARKLCQSIGYGLPYGVQFVNPMKVVEKHDYQSISLTAIPQADPNGLFSPPNVDATWVNCITTSGEQKPVYSEDKVITSPVPLDELKGNELR